MIIKNAVIHPMDGPVIDRGFVAVREGKIASVGYLELCPPPEPGEKVLDALGGHVCPGFVDAHCHLGVCGNAVGFESDDANEATNPCTPHLRALDAINPLDRCFEEARRAGVTTVLTGPGSANPISGQMAAVKTVGRVVDHMALLAPAAMKFAMGENPKNCYNERKEAPTTRMAVAAVIRENLALAVEYGEKKARADQDPDEDAPDYDIKCEALLPVTRGELPAHFHAHRADDIATALRISGEFGLRPVIVHGTEGYQIADYLAEKGVGVITGPCLTDRSKPELAGQTTDNPVLLRRAGVRVAICTDHPETPVQYLPLCAAMAVKAGMEPEDALAAVTSDAAVLAGVADRVGTLTPGKDGDLAVFDRHPLDPMAKVIAVLIDGREVK